MSYENDVATLMDSRSDWCNRLIQLSKLEYSSRSFIKRILDRLDENATDDNSILNVIIFT